MIQMAEEDREVLWFLWGGDITRDLNLWSFNLPGLSLESPQVPFY